MLRHGSRMNTITMLEDSQDQPTERTVRRLRLTLHPSESSSRQEEAGIAVTDVQGEKVSSLSKRSRRGYGQRERPVGAEVPVQSSMTNGMVEESLLAPLYGPRLYAVVQRTSVDSQQEVMPCEWSVSHMTDEVNYIREVRESLEKVRERMNGQFGGMQQVMQKLSQDMRVAKSRSRKLEAEVRSQTSALESFDLMNSSLMSANIDLQKSLLDKCADSVDAHSEITALRSSCTEAEERLKETSEKLAAAQEENHTLRLQVESSQEANSQALRELTLRLRSQYEAQLQQQQHKYREEVAALQAHLAECVKRAEEAEGKAKEAEAAIAERDIRIAEVERLLNCMAQEKRQLEQKLQDCEQRLRRLGQAQHADAAAVSRSRQLAAEAAELKERIKHLNDMVFNQQRKVKGLIQEVEALKAKVAEKELFITELLDRIAIVECENNEMEDKLKYYMSVQNVSRGAEQTRDIGVACDLPLRLEAQVREETHYRTVSNHLAPPSRLNPSLYNYIPLQYTVGLQSRLGRLYAKDDVPLVTGDTLNSSQTNSTGSDIYRLSQNQAASVPMQSSPHQSNPQPKSSPSKIYTPFMRLMEMTAAIKID